MTHRSPLSRCLRPGSGRIGRNQTEWSGVGRAERIVAMMDGPMGSQMEDQMVLLQNMSTDW